MKYFQCELHQGTERLVGWIEDRGAKEGLRVEVKTRDGLWRVAKVWEENPIDAAWLAEKRGRDRKGLKSIRQQASK
jgi:hypothetical protein